MRLHLKRLNRTVGHTDKLATIERRHKMSMSKDMRTVHGMECYCEECCATALDWYEWRNRTDDNVSGPRYWTREHAIADRVPALGQGH